MAKQSAWAILQQNNRWLVLNESKEAVVLCGSKEEAEIIRDAVSFTRELAEEFPHLATQVNQEEAPNNFEDYAVKILTESNGLRIWWARARGEKLRRADEIAKKEAEEKEQKLLKQMALARDRK